MGTRVAPTLANMFMGNFERQHVYTYKLQPLIWARFIDDIFLLWTHGSEELDQFIHHKSSIKFTSEISDTQVPFLDTLVIKSGNTLYTDLYTKPTDVNNFLHFDSAHPPHCKKGIPFGQFLRLRRICSRQQDFDKHGLIKASHFLARGSPPKLIVQSFLRARNLDPKELTSSHARPNSDKPHILVTTFHPTFHDLRKIVRSNWEILSYSSKTRELFDDRLVIALRKPPNLRNSLIRARTDFHIDTSEKHHAATSGRTYNVCDNDQCRYCTRINTSGRITSSVTKRQYPAKHNVSCQSTNLIYCLTCKRCKTQYVGQTKHRLMDRFQDHFYKISKAHLHTDMGHHFNTMDHQDFNTMEIHIVDFIHCTPESPRAQRLRNMIEKNWIYRLKSMIPLGLNLIDAPIYD